MAEREAEHRRIVVETPTERREVEHTEAVRHSGNGVSGAALAAIVVGVIALAAILILFMMNQQQATNDNLAAQQPSTTIVQQPAQQQPPVIVQQPATTTTTQPPVIINNPAPAGASGATKRERRCDRADRGRQETKRRHHSVEPGYHRDGHGRQGHAHGNGEDHRIESSG